MQHLGEALMHIPFVIKVRLSSSEMVVMCPVLAMYEATICLLVLPDRLNFRGVVSPGKNQLTTGPSSQDQTDTSRFHHHLRCSTLSLCVHCHISQA